MKFIYRFRKTRSRWRRFKRLMFSSPGEVRLIELFGGLAIKVRWLKNFHNGHYFTPLYSVGPYFKRHGIRREVKVGSGKDIKFIDFATHANNRKKAIEVLSNRWHNSVVEDEKRKHELEGLGWEVLYVHFDEIRHSPTQTRAKVMKFLSK